MHQMQFMGDMYYAESKLNSFCMKVQRMFIKAVIDVEN